jgi:hypothetical protein
VVLHETGGEQNAQVTRRRRPCAVDQTVGSDDIGGGQSLLLTRRDLVDRRPSTLRDGCLCRRREKSEGYEYGWGEWFLVIVVINE